MGTRPVAYSLRGQASARSRPACETGVRHRDWRGRRYGERIQATPVTEAQGWTQGRKGPRQEAERCRAYRHCAIGRRGPMEKIVMTQSDLFSVHPWCIMAGALRDQP